MLSYSSHRWFLSGSQTNSFFRSHRWWHIVMTMSPSGLMLRILIASVQGFILLHSFCFPEDLGVSDWSVGTCSLPSRCKRFVYLVSGRLPFWLSPIYLKPSYLEFHSRISPGVRQPIAWVLISWYLHFIMILFLLTTGFDTLPSSLTASDRCACIFSPYGLPIGILLGIMIITSAASAS